MKQEENFEESYQYKIFHSAEHIFAQAVKELYGDKVTLAVAHIDEDGFSNDALWDEKLSEEDFGKIEKKMDEIINKDLPIVRKEISIEEARELFKNNKFKLEWAGQWASEGKGLTVYATGDEYVDLCKGPHVERTSEIKAFKLINISGAYWRGDEKNEMLTRVYGVAFGSKEELEDYLWRMEEAKKRDHRKIGKDMELFHFDEEIGSGLPLWLPKGNIIKEELESWAKKTEEAWGYQRVTTPIITKEGLFHTSGHLPLYKDSMYAPIKIEDENFYIKPMNCPFHHKVFSSRPRSYRELPLRVAEYGWCHRYEDSGSLFGLMRVRGMQMNDAHIYVSIEQAVEEFIQVIKLHEYYYKALGINEYVMELALRNSENMDKYHGDEADWKLAEKMTLEAMEKSGVPYKVVNDGAAFYGPKMDFQIKSSIGREFTASTNQLDLYMGKKFDLKYVDEDGSEKVPAIIHRAPLGTHERFIGFLIEHFAGAFPVWLHPEQVAIIPIGEKQNEYAAKVNEQIKAILPNARVKVIDNNDTLQKKIRDAQVSKIPYMLILGGREEENSNVSVRLRTEEQLGNMSIDEFIKRLKEKVESKALDL